MTSSHLTLHWKNFKPCELEIRNHILVRVVTACWDPVCVCVHVWKSSGMDVWEQASSWLFWLLCAVVFSHHSNELFTSVHVSWLTLFPFPICCFYPYFPPLWLFVSLTLHLSLSSYMVMPFVAQDLGHIMKKRRLTDRIITYLFYQLLRGLQVRFIFFI